MKLELNHVGLLVELANHYTTRGTSSRLFSGVGYNTDDLKSCFSTFFVHGYHNFLLQLFEQERKTMRTLVAEELYFGLILPVLKNGKQLKKKKSKEYRLG